MKVIKLKEQEISLLRENSINPDIKKIISNASFDDLSSSWILLLKTYQIEIIADDLIAILMEKGMENGEVNSFGKAVDNLINKFNHYD